MIRLPHLPPLSPGSGALIPIGLSLLFRPKTRWKFRRMDLWVVVFMISLGLSEVLRENIMKDGLVQWSQDFIEMFLVYIVGRQLIEPNLRLETVKRIIFLFVCQTPFALYERRISQNVWLNLARNVFGVETGWFVQIRGGTDRIATVFGHAILAGMMFVVAFALNYYLAQIYKLDKTRLGPRMSMLQKYRVPFLALPLMLLLTGSRMPMACGVLCYLLLQIPRFKNMRTGLIVILLVVGVGGGTIYSLFQAYTNVTDEQELTEAQSSAVYRKVLLVNYAPVVEEGGWLGWGVNSIPRVGGQVSIDNQYLILQLGQGRLGEYTFLLLGFEGLLALAICAVRFKSRESLFLVFSLMGALIGIFVALSTVSLYEQATQVLFLILGWSQSLQDLSPQGASALSSLPEPKFRFKRVIA
jgi:hypothetical protein